ncbi:MAG: BatA domain-containing protein [Flavobacteriales bacterium]|nr:BatA domain-containing protein [Flavobacteriales bacterium]
MQFLYPGFLLALFALVIPVLIHLFNFRRFKRVPFTNLRFLREVKQQSQKQKNLKHILILVSRCLALACLVFAFAQPYLPSSNKKIEKGRKAVSIYVDNSFSMNALSEKGPLLEVAKAKAREIAAAYKATDKFQLLTNEFNGSNERFTSRDEFIANLDNIELNPGYKSLKQIVQKQEQLLSNSGIELKKAYIISDFQKSFANASNVKFEDQIEGTFIPLSRNNTQNLLIDSVWFTSPVFQPKQPLELIVRIKNSGEQSLEGGTVSLKLNEVQKAVSGFDLAPEESKDISIIFSVSDTGWQNAALNITDHPITFDDTWYFTFEMREHIKVLYLFENVAVQYIEKAYLTEPFLALQTVKTDQIDYSKLERYDLILLQGIKDVSSGMAQELEQFVKNGGNIAVFPFDTTGSTGINSLMIKLGASSFGELIREKTDVSVLDFSNDLLANSIENERKNLDLPKTSKHFKLHTGSIPGYQVATLRNGDVFLKSYKIGKGHLFQYTVDLNSGWSNFQQNQIFIPLMFRMAFMKQSQIPLSYYIGRNEMLKPVSGIKKSSKPNILKGEQAEFILEKIARNNDIFLSENNMVVKDGLYDLLDGDNRIPLQKIAFNYDRLESDMEVIEQTKLQEIFESSGFKVFQKTDMPLNTLIKQEEQGKPLWRIFILLTLLFFGIEILLLRFWKNNQSPNTQAVS